MKKIRKFIRVFTLAFCFIATPLFNVKAQNVDVIALMLYKDYKERVKKDRLEIGLLIKDTVNIVSLNTNHCELLEFRDDTGENLLVEENEKKQAFINGRAARVIDEGLIFQIEAHKTPNKKATNIRIKATLSYKVVDSGESEIKYIKNENFKTLDTLWWFKKNVKVYKSNYNDSRKGAMIWYKFKSDVFDVIIEKIEETNLEGEVIGEFNFSRYPDYYQLNFQASEIGEPKNLKITYKKAKNKVIILDRKIGLGF